MKTTVPFIPGLAKPKTTPTNRHQKRAMLLEYEKLFGKVWQLENEMYQLLFEGGDTWSYDAHYRVMLSEFNGVVDYCNSNISYWTVNEQYFAKVFGA